MILLDEFASGTKLFNLGPLNCLDSNNSSTTKSKVKRCKHRTTDSEALLSIVANDAVRASMFVCSNEPFKSQRGSLPTIKMGMLLPTFRSNRRARYKIEIGAPALLREVMDS